MTEIQVQSSPRNGADFSFNMPQIQEIYNTIENINEEFNQQKEINPVNLIQQEDEEQPQQFEPIKEKQEVDEQDTDNEQDYNIYRSTNWENIKWQNQKLIRVQQQQPINIQQQQQCQQEQEQNDEQMLVNLHNVKKQMLMPKLQMKLEDCNDIESVKMNYSVLYELFVEGDCILQKVAGQLVDLKNDMLEQKTENELKVQKSEEVVKELKIQFGKLQEQKGIEKLVGEYESQIMKQIKMKNKVQQENQQLIQRVADSIDRNSQINGQDQCYKVISEFKNELSRRNAVLSNQLDQKSSQIQGLEQQLRQQKVAKKLYEDLLMKSEKMQNQIIQQDDKLYSQSRQIDQLQHQNSYLQTYVKDVERINQEMEQELIKQSEQLIILKHVSSQSAENIAYQVKEKEIDQQEIKGLQSQVGQSKQVLEQMTQRKQPVYYDSQEFGAKDYQNGSEKKYGLTKKQQKELISQRLNNLSKF